MDLNELEAKAWEALEAHELDGWFFKFDNAVNRFGYCSYTDRTISISGKLAALNDEATCMNTLTHEIAHALVGSGHGHDRIWAAMHRSLGGDGKSYCEESSIVTAKKLWKVSCTVCDMTTGRSRKTKNSIHLVCAQCNSKGLKSRLKWEKNF